jgi:hypothetical protein
MRRSPINSRRAAPAFNRSVGRTKAANTAAAPMRGGWRL